MVCEEAEIAASAVLAMVVPSALSVLTALVPVDVAVLSSAVSAVAFVLVPSSALSVSLLVSASCGCCLRLHGFRNGCHGHRRADYGRARDRAEQVVKGSFHCGASR